MGVLWDMSTTHDAELEAAFDALNVAEVRCEPLIQEGK